MIFEFLPCFRKLWFFIWWLLSKRSVLSESGDTDMPRVLFFAPKTKTDFAPPRGHLALGSLIIGKTYHVWAQGAQSDGVFVFFEPIIFVQPRSGLAHFWPPIFRPGQKKEPKVWECWEKKGDPESWRVLVPAGRPAIFAPKTRKLAFWARVATLTCPA